MIVRRVGLVLALLLSLAGILAALEIGPDPATGSVGVLPVVVAVLACMIAAFTVALLVPAWRGSHRASLTIATAQLVGILTALPAFFAPAGLVPPGGVILAAAGTLVSIAVFAMIAFDVGTLALHAVAVIVIVALYASGVAAATWLLPSYADRLVQTLAAIAVALAFQPLVSLLRRTVGQALYGGRVAPAATAVRVNRPRPDGTDPVTAAVRDTATALRLPRIELVHGGVVVATGTSTARAGATVIDHALADADALHLRVTLRAGERTLHRDDRDALTLIALPLAPLVRESTLLAEVRAARAAVADAREREQLRLHRDLHDGLGPLLTGAVMRADAARNLIGDEPALVQLDAARADLRTALTELRRVVYGLWPLELEQRGLSGAIATRAARAGIEARVPTAELLLPPAVELAVYRIASEAITNIEKHAAGGSGTLALECNPDEIVLTVKNQASTGSSSPDGLGVASMRARAEELGGRVDAGATADGWRVLACLPLTPDRGRAARERTASR